MILSIFICFLVSTHSASSATRLFMPLSLLVSTARLCIATAFGRFSQQVDFVPNNKNKNKNKNNKNNSINNNNNNNDEDNNNNNNNNNHKQQQQTTTTTTTTATTTTAAATTAITTTNNNKFLIKILLHAPLLRNQHHNQNCLVFKSFTVQHVFTKLPFWYISIQVSSVQQTSIFGELRHNQR